MTPRLLLDENQRGPLWGGIQRHNEHTDTPLDAIRVGDEGAPPFATSDPDLLAWCESTGRILVSEDKQSLPGHLANHLASGQHSPGIFLIRPGQSIRAVLDFLKLAIVASDADEWRDTITYIP